MKLSDIMGENSKLATQLKSPKYEISILSNIITTQLNEILEYTLRREGINAYVLPGDYDNIVQDSNKEENYPLTIIFWELINFIDGFQYRFQNLSEIFLNDLINKIKSEIDLVFENLKSRPRILFNTFSTSLFTTEKLKITKLDNLCIELNDYIYQKKPANTVIIDLEKIFKKLPYKSSVDWRYYYSSKALYTVEFYKYYTEFVQPIILSTLGKSKKVLLLDCDNTLWKGIIGEDGFEGIEMSSHSKNGVFFEEIQNTIVRLVSEGVVVCLVSKNNPEDVEQVFKENPNMTLKDNHIVAKKVNWIDKASNIKELAEELNLGLDSFVFVDDSDFEINLVREKLPQVTCFQVPKKLYEYPSMFREIEKLFYKINTSKEDTERVVMYKQERQRESQKNVFGNVEDYLKSLELKLKIYLDDPKLIERVAQLTQKTNQFNLTTIRYTESEIEGFMKSENSHVIAFGLLDKFGDYGITGVSIIKKENRNVLIDSFLMSCRILGRNAEVVFFDYMMNLLEKDNFLTVNAAFFKTQKNEQVENFYDKLGYEIISKSGEEKKYSLNLKSYHYHSIDYIEVIDGRAN
jgi:FkbH-like protein